MRALILDADIRARIAAAVAHAEAHPIPWSTLRAGVMPRDTAELKFEDRGPDFGRPPGQRLLIPNGFQVAFSVEEQPAGFCHRLSVLDQHKHRPSIKAVQRIAVAYGIKQWHKFWLEEFDFGHWAVSILELYRPAMG